MQKQPLLKDQTLLDKFLFDQAMDVPEVHETVLQIIFDNDEIFLSQPPQTEKEFRRSPDKKSIKVDVFAMDGQQNVYDTEMQGYNKNDLCKRSRYYQALIDVNLLPSGSTNYNKLNNSFIVIIAPFDLFGQNRYVYTFRSYCVEDKNLELTDGATRIILNTKGKNDHDIPPGLIDFLHYVDSGKYRKDSPIASRLAMIDTHVQDIKNSEEMGVRYMQHWEELLEAKEEGLEEGIVKGRKEGLAEGNRNIILNMSSKGLAPEEIHELTGISLVTIQECLNIAPVVS